MQSCCFCCRDAASENCESTEHSLPSPDHSYFSIDETREQSVLQPEIITTASAAASAGCNLELRETESAPNDNSFRDHQYAVLFPKGVHNGHDMSYLCDKMFDTPGELERYFIRFHKSTRKCPPRTDEHSYSALAVVNTELALSNSGVCDTTIQKMNKPSEDILTVCKCCGWISDNSVSLEAHMQIHRREKQESEAYVCDMCRMLFDVRQKFLSHIARHNSRTSAVQKVYVCNLCDKTFKLRRYLKRHSRLHESKSKHPPVTDAYSNCAVSQVRTELARSNNAVDDNTVQKMNVNRPSVDTLAMCKLCGWSSDRSVSLEDHMQTHRSGKQESEAYMCDLCGMLFDVRWKFLKHAARDHSRTTTVGQSDNQSNHSQQDHQTSAVAARATCDLCGWVSKNSNNTTSQTFLEHMRTHTGEKPFKCGQCALTFTTKHNLHRHELSHTDRGRFLCQYCAQSFHQKDSLLSHMYKKHADKLDPDPSKWPFCCRYCSERFHTSHHVRRHVHKQHESVFCEACDKMFHGYFELQNHNCAHSGAFGCNVCQTSYTSADGLKQHLLIHETDNVGAMYKCDWCSEQFELITALECHVVDIHSVVLPQYHCSKCEKSFITQVQLKQHMRVHTEAPFVCSVCGKRFKLTTNLNLHMATHDTNKSGQKLQNLCTVCGKTFNTEIYLRQHMHVVHTEKTQMCTVCGKKFSLLSTLTIHMLTHSRGGQYQCSECEKSFSMESTLKLHMRLHSKDAFTCTVCNKKFMFCSMLKYHMATHKPPAERDIAQLITCTICGKHLSSKQTLKCHEHAHAGVKPYLCNLCGRLFRQSVHLTRHMQTHMKFKPYSCSLCSKAYSNRVDLCIHCTRVHNVHLPVHRRVKSGINNCQDNAVPTSLQ